VTLQPLNSPLNLTLSLSDGYSDSRCRTWPDNIESSATTSFINKRFSTNVFDEITLHKPAMQLIILV
jgi:hypothetical protein